MTLDPERIVNVAVQVLPLADDPYPLVDQAIAAIRRSGVHHEVDTMKTVTPRPTAGSSKEGRGVMEGPLNRLLDVARSAHVACLEAGAERVVTITPRPSSSSLMVGRGVIKIADGRQGTTIAEKVDRLRQDGG